MLTQYKKIYSLILVVFCFNTFLFAQNKIPNGLWKFDDTSNLKKSETGNELEFSGTPIIVNGPSELNGAIRINKGTYIKVDHGISPNSGKFVNEYTLQIDFRIPRLNEWYTFFQTSPSNSNDGECFIDLSGYIGVQATGYSTYAVKPNEWYRLVITVKNGTHYKYYLEGQLILNGFYQNIDSRFALDKTLLMFADDNGEDGTIDCAEIAIWDYSLSESEIKTLGDFGHGSKLLIRVPYLQTPSSNSIIINWHDTTSTGTKVEFGTTHSLGQTESGSSETIAESYIWHTVKLKGLTPNTEYFYRVKSSAGSSEIYSFRTLPDNNYTGKLRFLLLSDTHANDTTMTSKIIREAKKKIKQLYGEDFQNKISLVLHSGDMVVTGYDVMQWTDQYFAPMAPLSPYVPFMTVSGNHEGESFNYYSYMKYDDVSAFPSSDLLSERFWSMNIANTAIIGINSNLTNSRRTHQTEWLERKLQEIESNPQIDFVIVLVHHLPISELWGEGISDAGSVYVRSQIIPILKKYSKIVQLSYGHTHGFERGTIESEKQNGDFRIICGGGGGGPLDIWGSYKNFDFPNIHISLDHYSFQLIEIDVAAKTFEASLFSLGNQLKPRDAELLDSWYKKLNQPAPSKPTAYYPTFNNFSVTFNSSRVNNDSLMSVRIQVSEDPLFNKTFVDSMFHWKNIYGVDVNFNPADLNRNIDLTNISLNHSLFLHEKKYFYRVRYRDHNLKWSDWSNSIEFVIPDISDDTAISSYELMQNYPNPFNSSTKIIYQIPQNGIVSLRVFDVLGKEVAVLVNTEKKAGRYEATFDSSNLSSGVYFYTLQFSNSSKENNYSFNKTRKLIIIK